MPAGARDPKQTDRQHQGTPLVWLAGARPEACAARREMGQRAVRTRWPGWDGRLRSPLVVARGPADRVEYGDGVEVVAPVCDLAVLDRDEGDKVVVVGVPGVDRSAVDGVFEDDD